MRREQKSNHIGTVHLMLFKNKRRLYISNRKKGVECFDFWCFFKLKKAHTKKGNQHWIWGLFVELFW